jgi:hypothetical protein
MVGLERRFLRSFVPLARRLSLGGEVERIAPLGGRISLSALYESLHYQRGGGAIRFTTSEGVGLKKWIFRTGEKLLALE